MITPEHVVETQNLLPQLYRDWQHDRDLQHLVPLRHCWRGCLGLALLVDHFDDHAVSCGAHTFQPNHALRWLAVRDLPPIECPGDAAMDFRGACIASICKATLSYGMPSVNFTRNARDDWDLKHRPVHSGLDGLSARPDILDARHYAREWAVLNRLNATMTDFAFNAVDGYGQPLRRAWHYCHPPGSRPCPPTPATGVWFPMAYLAFKHADLRRLDLTRPAADGSGVSANPIVHLSPKVALVPATLLSHRQQTVAPASLWWDLSDGALHLNVHLEAFLFPPLRLVAFNRLRQALPGDVQLEASFGKFRACSDVLDRQGHDTMAQRLPLKPAIAA